MANKEKIDYLLLDIKELETLIAGMRDAEVYPVSFFSQTFNLTHKILNDLHSLEDVYKRQRLYCPRSVPTVSHIAE